jgi:hypothetical protein
LIGPIGTIVVHKPSSRLGVVVSLPTGGTPDEGQSPVHFSTDSTSTHELVSDIDLQLVKTTYSVSPAVLADSPDWVRSLINELGTVTVDYGSEKYVVTVQDNGELALIPAAAS